MITESLRRFAAAETTRRGVCQVIMSFLGHLGNLFADHRKICFGSNCCTAFARPGGHINVGPPDEPGRQPWPWVMKASSLDGMSAWHESYPFIVTRCCAQSSPCLLSRDSSSRLFCAATHPHRSAYPSRRLLHRSHTAAPLAHCRGQIVTGRLVR